MASVPTRAEAASSARAMRPTLLRSARLRGRVYMLPARLPPLTTLSVEQPEATVARAPWRRLRRRPLALAAVALVGLDAILAAAGARVPALDAMVLVLAPGMAFLPLLPARLHAHSLAAVAALPTLGIALSMVALVSAARLC